ncbi:MAG: hypothetical protein V9G12_09865 [Microthrixaceae bacterium]
MQGELFQRLTWARIIGGALFVLGGVLPLAWFMLTRLAALKSAVPARDAAPTNAAVAPILD